MIKTFFKTIKKLFSKRGSSVAVIYLSGVIGSSKGFSKVGLNLDGIKSSIDKAFELPQLKAVALSINSPGGSPVQSELIYNYIRNLADEKKIKVFSFAEDVAASGGYWLACAGDEIYASANSIIGSIGVISYGFGFVDAIKKLGIERRVYTQGKNKSVLDPFKPEKPEDLKIVHNIQRDIHDSFKALILSRRKNKLNASEEILFNGEFWSGKKALELGLIDNIGDLYSVIKEKFGKKCKIVKIGGEQSWLRKRLGFSVNSDEIIDNTITKIEEKIALSKFGL
jgi:signal peptide peptidase SppA